MGTSYLHGQLLNCHPVGHPTGAYTEKKHEFKVNLKMSPAKGIKLLFIIDLKHLKAWV